MTDIHAADSKDGVIIFHLKTSYQNNIVPYFESVNADYQLARFFLPAGLNLFRHVHNGTR